MSPVSTVDFRKTLGKFPTGVTIVTALDQGTPVGLTVNAFMSVSLEPPLVAFCAGHTSTSWPAVRRAGRFAVNILASDQRELCMHYAKSGGEKFSGVSWRKSGLGSPILEGCAAWLDCEIHAVHESGDHSIVVGAVDTAAHNERVEPLVFYGSEFRVLGDLPEEPSRQLAEDSGARVS